MSQLPMIRRAICHLCQRVGPLLSDAKADDWFYDIALDAFRCRACVLKRQKIVIDDMQRA